ncbi:MAG: hypothetical protein KatS3mg110_2322 [Pirellulaceae bacterium]|nr:MAG: hypothetical protein KatS3mg110_2322 [Pirellulaceae bacterium]
MHGHNEALFLEEISSFLGLYYLFLAALNAGAAFYLWRRGRGIRLIGPIRSFHCWLLLALLFTMIAPLAFSGDPQVMRWISLPPSVRDFIDWLMGPVVYSVGTVAVLTVLFVGRRFFVKPTVAWLMLNGALLFMGLAMTDPDFADIVRKPDNVPIVGLIYLLGYFTWLGAYLAVENDKRIQQGLPPKEKELDEKVLVWPDLVYTELICMIAVTALLFVWAICIKAPLEEPASAVKTPNPSKAPWYFLGLQEMLVYYDPWMAGVVLPSLIIFGLMAIPYLDFNKKGNGYYTIDERKFSYIVFQFGFIVLWVTLIVLGTFLRGPNWNFFGPFETWDPHKVEALNNVDLSEFFWVRWLQRARPRPPEDAGMLIKVGVILIRELPGILLLIGYFAITPAAMVVWSRFFRELFKKMGLFRYMTMMFLLQVMLLLPVKMVCRWSFNLKYFIAIPEWMLNF